MRSDAVSHQFQANRSLRLGQKTHLENPLCVLSPTPSASFANFQTYQPATRPPG